MNLLFEARNITKQFANHKALDEVSISVPEQSIFGLLGPNGAGEQALYLARLKGLSKSDALKKLRYWFEKFEIQGWWNKKVEELSKGMQQKVQFIVTIIHEPELLIFDEPFSGFDPINVNLLKEEILKLRDNGATIIFSTHNMASVEELCDHIALIDRSKKILDGKVLDIRNKFKSNTYEISFKGFNGDLNSILGNNYNLIESRDDDELQTVRIRIVNGNKPNDLIKLLLPHVNFNSINEILPTMNDIFISKVQENE